jgi:hypothetical protein
VGRADLRASPFNEGLSLNTNFIARSISLESTFNAITIKPNKRRTVNQRKAELLAAAGVDPAESAPPQMLSDLAEKLRQERVPHRIISLMIFREKKMTQFVKTTIISFDKLSMN